MKKILPLLPLLVILPLAGVAGVAGLAAPPPGAAPAPPPSSASSPRPLAPDDIYALKTLGDPRVSPDGRFVAYTVRVLEKKEDGSDTDIYMAPISPVDGGEPLRLTGSPKAETSPRWSPDGRYLAFLSNREGKKTQVWLLPRAGGEAFQLTTYKADVGDLAWSPDGRRLALIVADVDPDDPDLADEADKKEKNDEPAKAPKPIVI